MNSKIDFQSPDRVLVRSDGRSLGSKRARSEGVEHVIVFIRDDGWTLGAPADMELLAYDLFDDCWVGFVRKSGEVQEISEYERPEPIENEPTKARVAEPS